MALICASAATTRFASIRLSTSSSSTKIDRKLWPFSPGRARAGFKVQAFFNPFESKPIVKEALKEPVAFLGGMFAGLLRLDLNEDPLKEWIERTVKSAGLNPEEVESKLDGDEDLPQLIEIE
ncbi:UPF0426 protein At1g28150, chloroplastic [Phalaenopsis equestris]|uniref:UPF0426 protein At1g28150, chloroplastic n=1 Tax=Phalaenopsis equestris TaxID=78828 RepID=UPI0009E1AB8E|nr:UPF0426 protein At1g28150, chloroplastic [Phalaenopsis equestris]